MKKTVALLALIFIFVTAFNAQTVCKRQVESAGGFSYCPPEGWVKFEKEANYEFAGFETLRESKFPGSNLNIRTSVLDMSLADFVTESNKYTVDAAVLDSSVKSIELLGRSEFTTMSGLNGEKIWYQVKTKRVDAQLLTIQFYFAGAKNKKFILTYTILESNKGELEKIIEDSAKTFQIEK